jgi:dipeptidase E
VRRLLLLSNSRAPGGRFLEHALPRIATMVERGARIAFVPYASDEHEAYERTVAGSLATAGVDLASVHRAPDPAAAVREADGVFVGGGNTFRLLRRVNDLDLVEPLRRLVAEGRPYIGASAGSNLACPTIRTTNDMPILEPPGSLNALGLIPFQLNAHYPLTAEWPAHIGESRDQRLDEFLAENDVPVLCLREGSWLQVEGDRATTGGVTETRLLRRGRQPAEISPGGDVSDLLAVAPAFDRRA